MTPNFPALIKSSENGKHILMFDASAYSQSSCSKYIEYLIIQGLGSPAKCHKMEYGTAVHKALASYYTNGDKTKAIQEGLLHFATCGAEIPEGDYRTPTHLLQNLEDYFRHWGAEDDYLGGEKFIEKKFALPIYQDDKCEILVCGTIDIIQTRYSGRRVVDHKSFAVFGSPETKVQAYSFSPQLMLYRMIYEILFPGDDVRAVGCEINGIGLKRPLKSEPRAKNIYLRSDTFYFSDEQMGAFRRHFELTVQEIAKYFTRLVDLGEEFPRNYTQCEGKYGMCRYSQLCMTPKNERDKMIEYLFSVGRYNPLRFQE